MDRELSHDDITAMLGAYALDAVELDEAAFIAAHLADCPRCAAEVAEHHEVAGLIANAGVDAPPEVWEQISARIGAAGATASGRVVLPGAGPAPGDEVRGHARRRASWAWRGAVVTVAAAAVAVITVLGVQVSHLDNRVGQLATAGEHAGLQQSVQAALLDPQAHTVPLAAASGTGASRARAVVLVILPDGTAYALNTGLPPLATDRTYQLWGAVGNRVVSLGLLGSHPGDVAFRVDPSSAISSYAVTAEVGGGVVRPTHAPVARSTTAA